jgi:hypothetical protein
MRPFILALGLLVSSLAVACAPSAESVARARAANEFSCPQSSIVVRELSAGTEVVNACGQQAVYTCPKDRSHRVCIREAPTAATTSAVLPAR